MLRNLVVTTLLQDIQILLEIFRSSEISKALITFLIFHGDGTCRGLNGNVWKCFRHVYYRILYSKDQREDVADLRLSEEITTSHCQFEIQIVHSQTQNFRLPVPNTSLS